MAYIGTDINYGNLAKQTGTGDGADTTPIAALTYTVPSSESILVFLDGVCQVPSTDFTATGTTLTFTTAPANGVAILVMFLGRSLDIGTPADNTVDETKLKDALIGDFSDVTVTAADTFLYGDATDSGNTKKDTIQGVLDLVPAGGGITQASLWRLTANLTGVTSAADISANLEEDDSTGAGKIGSSMTHSSGIFTFPATGFWWIMVHAYLGTDSPGTDHSNIRIMTTTNDSTYAGVATAQAGTTPGGGNYTHATTSHIFDVTSTSNCKVKFQQNTEQGSGSEWKGTTTETYTGFVFVRLGDT
jgi:hypothetical protein